MNACPFRPGRAAPWLTLAAALLACSGAGKGSGGGLDPSKPDDALLAQGLERYDAAAALAAAARALADPSARAAGEAEAAAGYAAAQAVFARLPAEYPASPRVDNASYLEGRCAYEIGSLTGERARFEEARALLAAAAAAYPGSPLLDSISYFCGRAHFRLAEVDAAAPSAATAAVRALYAEAWSWFDRSAQASAAGTWGDNAAYYRGRCDFEMGLLDVSPLEAGAVAPAPGTAGWLEAMARFDRAEALLGDVPASSTYFDNARYYLGRSHFEEPADVAASRIGNLESAIAAFDAVTRLAASPYADGARYWRGRSRYALAFWLGTGGVYAEAPLPLAIADLKAVRGASVYRDNALHWTARAYLKFVPPYCAAPRAGDAAPASACAARAALAADFPASGYVVQTDGYLSTAGCTCP